ncbi:hypothetical protein HID58_032854 [Brassica napus]|uniref:Protein kinase domain-containing protein n=2 Tax=Brassica TaxID=3705 RepID=A0ABQ8BYR4_BRANA|nr:hypothetical protein HID58_032854 [Brassica napus]
MTSFDMNPDMIIEILSHSPASLVGKCRLLNKECNKRTYDSSFLKLNLQRTNSVSGYFLEFSERLRVHSAFVRDLGNIPSGSDEISLDFLPPGRVSIKACDASHGILLCVNDLPVKGRQPEYIVCKPTTKQYMILPKPKTRYFTIALGLMVIGSDPFRYKILRLSQLPGNENRRYSFSFTLVCEVFDSDSFAWKRLNNVELPEEDLLVPRAANPVASYGFLHWLTTSNNVFRFCFKTNSWSFFPVPENLASDDSLKLTRYDGKVGVISSRSKEGVDYQDLWVLERSFGDSWFGFVGYFVQSHLMEQFRQIGEVLGSLNALMVLQDDILINQRQCCLLLDIFSLGFNTVAEEIRQNLKLEEKHTKWRALEQPLKELYRVFKEGETYVRSCMSNKDWWGKVINFHQNKDCVEFHIHNLFCYFPAVIEAIETAGEISGLDPSEMDRRRVVFSRKYDREWNDPKLFQWRFGKQYLIPKDICSRFENAWREDRWNLVEALQQKRKSKSDEIGKTEKRLADFLLKKLTGLEQFNGKLFPSSILVGSKDYQVRRRLGGGGQYKEIQWLGDSFVLRHFLGDLEPLDAEISSLLSLCHSNILQYLCGFYDKEKKECSLVMELMHKDLKSYMKENCGPRRRYLFSVPVVIDIILQIARGMEYLHSNEIFHGDLNPMNILLKERSHTEGYFHAKISGFGLNSVKTFTRASSRPTTPAPVIWYAPEVLTEMEQDLKGITVPRSKFTHKADVYSFAMVCFELITGKVPFEDSHLQGDEMGKNIRRGDRPLFPFPSPKYLVSLIKRCWHSEPSQRPTFSSICRILRYVKKFLVVNPDQGHIQIQTPLVDCWDLEARFLRKFSIETGSHAESVMQIPFQLYSYRVAEKEKMSPNLNKEESSDTGGESASESVSDPPTTTPKYTKSLCLDAISEYSESDTRSLYSEAPKKKISPASKKSGDMAKLRRNSSAGLRSTGSSPVKPRPAPKVSLPLSPFGRNSKARKDTRLPLSPMSPMSPLGHTRRSRHLSGPASDSELT